MQRKRIRALAVRVRERISAIHRVRRSIETQRKEFSKEKFLGQDETSSLGLCDCSSAHCNAGERKHERGSRRGSSLFSSLVLLSFARRRRNVRRTRPFNISTIGRFQRNFQSQLLRSRHVSRDDCLSTRTTHRALRSNGKTQIKGNFLFALRRQSNRCAFQLQMTPQHPFFHMDLKEIWVRRFFDWLTSRVDRRLGSGSIDRRRSSIVYIRSRSASLFARSSERRQTTRRNSFDVQVELRSVAEQRSSSSLNDIVFVFVVKASYAFGL